MMGAILRHQSESSPRYRSMSGRKASAGPIVAGKIGLPTLRSKCGHFGDWLDKLEHLEREVAV